MPSLREEQMRRDYYRDIDSTGRAGSALTQQFTQGIGAFDPQAALDRRLQSEHDMFAENFGEDLMDLRGRQSKMGRNLTGFGQQDEDRLLRDSRRNLQRVSGQLALQTSGQELDRLGMIGQLGDRKSERTLSARSGEYQTTRQQRLEDERSRRSRWGNLLTAGLGAAGTILGGPIGGALLGGAGKSLTT